MSEERVHEHAGLPVIRITRDDDGTLEVSMREDEWPDRGEMESLASWLVPSVETFGQHDEIALAIGHEPVSLRLVGKTLADLMAIMRDARKLRMVGRQWRFTGGNAPADGAPKNEWGEYAHIVVKRTP